MTRPPRTSRESVRSVGLLSNRLILAGIAVEIALVALLAYTPGLDDIFHTSGLSGWEWLFLTAWPPIVLGAEELRKAVVRRNQPEWLTTSHPVAPQTPAMTDRRSW
jgi:hypothetical protein